jgi:hypothetical protein
MDNQNQTAPYFTVHSVSAMEKGAFSIWHGNIENTPEKLSKAKEIYPSDEFYIEFHHIKYDMRPVLTKY